MTYSGVRTLLSYMHIPESTNIVLRRLLWNSLDHLQIANLRHLPLQVKFSPTEAFRDRSEGFPRLTLESCLFGSILLLFASILGNPFEVAASSKGSPQLQALRLLATRVLCLMVQSRPCSNLVSASLQFRLSDDAYKMTSDAASSIADD